MKHWTDMNTTPAAIIAQQLKTWAVFCVIGGGEESSLGVGVVM
jgi:hypothetical protein